MLGNLIAIDPDTVGSLQNWSIISGNTGGAFSLNQATETSYVEQDAVTREVAYARRMFADNGWPVIDVTRRSVEETATLIIQYRQRQTSKRRAAAEVAEAAKSDLNMNEIK